MWSDTVIHFSLSEVVMKILGIIVMIAGVVVWCGNVFGFMPTFPLAGYITFAIGAFMMKQGSSKDNQESEPGPVQKDHQNPGT